MSAAFVAPAPHFRHTVTMRPDGDTAAFLLLCPKSLGVDSSAILSARYRYERNSGTGQRLGSLYVKQYDRLRLQRTDDEEGGGGKRATARSSC